MEFIYKFITIIFMRCFIAVDLDKDIVKQVKRIREEIGNLNVDVKFVELENLHFTLKFLGEVSEDEIDMIKKSVEECFKGVCSFNIEIRGVGYFGSQKHIRTLWLDVIKGKDEFVNLMNNLNKGLKIGEKNRTVHLTIGRVKSGRNTESLLSFINKHKDVNIGEMAVKDVKLKSSLLTMDGPIYSDLATFELGGVNSE